jgi:hypothetical protein
MRSAAAASIDGLPTERMRTLFETDSDEWRLWNNGHRYHRIGTSFQEMTAAQA